MIILKIFGFLILLIVGVIAYRVGKVLWFIKKMKDAMLSKQSHHQNHKSVEKNILDTQECVKCGQFMSVNELKQHQCKSFK